MRGSDSWFQLYRDWTMIHLFWPSTSCWQCWTNSTGETFQESLEQERCLQLQWKLQLSEEASGRLLRARDLSWTGRIYGLVCFYWKHLETRCFPHVFHPNLDVFTTLGCWSVRFTSCTRSRWFWLQGIPAIFPYLCSKAMTVFQLQATFFSAKIGKYSWGLKPPSDQALMGVTSIFVGLITFPYTPIADMYVCAHCA